MKELRDTIHMDRKRESKKIKKKILRGGKK